MTCDEEAAHDLRVDVAEIDVSVDDTRLVEARHVRPELLDVARVGRGAEEHLDAAVRRHDQRVVAGGIGAGERQTDAACDGGVIRGDADPDERSSGDGVAHVTL